MNSRVRVSVSYGVKNKEEQINKKCSVFLLLYNGYIYTVLMCFCRIAHFNTLSIQI